MFSDDYFSKAMELVNPKVNNWIKDLLGGAEQMNLTRSQKELIQALTVETLLYNSFMSNQEIIAILSDIIRNIATHHAYGNLLDWSKRESIFNRER
ncbi:MAG TPA: hypothetical protein VH415_01785 [Nitrososphaeraceae archaeon]|jgi:hypothetical protein